MSIKAEDSSAPFLQGPRLTNHVLYGYRVGEVQLPDIPAIKADCKFNSFSEIELVRRPAMRGSLGPHVEGAALPVPDTNDPANMKAGAAKRFCTSPPKINRQTLRRFQRFVRKWVRKNLLPLDSASDTSVVSWLAKTNYTDSRKQELLRKWNANPDIREKRNHYVKMFLKDEAYPEYKYARGINSRVDEFKCATGPIFKLIEEQLFKLPYFIKKIPVNERPSYIANLIGHGRKFMATDYSSFETAFVREMMLACECELYDYMVSEIPDGRDFMLLVRKYIAGKNDIKNKYFSIILEATRMSGEMNTSLGNGFSNLMVMLFLASEGGATDVAGIVEGDDGLFTMDCDFPGPEKFSELGFTIKMEIHDDFSKASFCGIIFAKEDLINITNPLKVLCNTGWTNRMYIRSSPRRKMELLKCKALSILYQYNGCPILTAYAKYLMRITKGVRAVPGQFGVWERDLVLTAMKAKFVEKQPGRATRELMQETFGILVEHQLELEKYFDSLEDVQPVKHYLLDLYFPADWEDFYFRYCRLVDTSSNLLDEPAMGMLGKAVDEIRVVNAVA